MNSATHLSSTELDLQREGKTLLVTFGGISQGIGIPKFEFVRITNSLPAKLLFIRDLNQSWYHSDLPKIGEGIRAIAQYILEIKSIAKVSKIVCIGNSMGGYAAILIGSLIQADEVISFSPQSFISCGLKLLYLDYRWSRQILHTYTYNQSAFYDAFDLKKFFLANSPGYSAATIFTDKNHRLDRIHAERLKKITKTKIIYRKGGHSMVKKMRETGELKEILIKSVL